MTEFSLRTFEEFHDLYLATDMVLADVLLHYRDEFYDSFQLDPCQFITLASASHSAMLKQCAPRPERSLGIITNSSVYELVKRNIRGGLANVAQPYASGQQLLLRRL